jgi:hypothetical protein
MSNSNPNLDKRSELARLAEFYSNNPDITLYGKEEDNSKMRRFFYAIALGGLKGNHLEFELSENEKIYNREQTLSDILNRNPLLFEQASSKKQARNMLTEAFRFFMERGNVLAALMLKIKYASILQALLSVAVVPKVIATALFGIFAILSSGELIRLAGLLALDSAKGMHFSFVVFLLYVLYFGLIDMRYLRPKLKLKAALLRGLYPAALLIFYTFVFLFLLIELLELRDFLQISKEGFGYDYFSHLAIITGVSGIFALLLQSLWDKESILRPI